MSADLSLDILLQWYEQMLTIRYFEDNAVSSFRKGLFGGSTHPQIAQEATAVGAAAALRPTDQVLATYRGHGHAICRGLPLGSIMAELLCKSTGCCGGRGGSMHLCDAERDFWGTNAIVAAHIPIAAGIALANQRRKDSRVVAVFFGDGATCEGAFFETLNMATLWKVPLVLVCENNGYAISVPTSKAHSVAAIAERALGFGLPGTSVDGNDPIAVYEAVGVAVERARKGEGPSLVECRTTRWERHSAISSGAYDNEEEAQKWKTVDPIPRFEKLLVERGAQEPVLQEIRQRAKTRNDEALLFAIDSPTPAPKTVGDFVFS